MNHEPVLLWECIDGLNIKPGGIYVDGTIGRGGHAREIVKRVGNGRLIAIDRDIDAINESKEALDSYKDRITFVSGNFKDVAMALNLHGIETVDGMLFDLGMSSPQLEDCERGFSYMNNAKLDMRMDRQDELTAFDAVNNWTQERLRKTFFEYGEERYSASIARVIVKKRTEAPIETTFDLNEVIVSAMPAAARREAQHPSKRCFQALRIAINDELGSIAGLLEVAPGALAASGRLCIISFHSLEDRLVKRAYAAYATGCICPNDFPVCACGINPSMKIITKRPIIPSEDEVLKNPRARSAKLRIAEKLPQ